MKSSVLRGAWPLLTLGVILAVADARAQGSNSAGTPVQSRLLHGRDALAALGNNLPAVAHEYGKSAREFEAILQRDRDLRIDPHGHALYACQSLANPPQERAQARGSAVPAPPFPLADTFKLHSRPQATKKIYLDFNGHVTSGTGWNQNFTGGADIVSAPFDQDGSPSSFGAGEHEAIQICWQMVAEDFAPFDVDVTTEDPGLEGLRRAGPSDQAFGVRVVISPTDAWLGQPAGGVAFLRSFSATSGATDTPCYAFTLNVANDARFIAEVSSHEVGHTVGLSHDGNQSEAYHGGVNGSIWAPIMGVGYGKPLVTWSKGEYPGANNTEDDYSVMQSNALLFRQDDHANSTIGATLIAGSSLNVSGVIQGVNDKDFFRIGSNVGSITVNANPAVRSPNLDIRMELLDAAGQLVQAIDLGGLNATVTRDVPEGVYFVSIDGVGSGDVAGTGYSDYGSLGQYTITGNVQGGIGLRLLFPNAAKQSLTAGTTQSITWLSRFIFSNVKLEYSVNGGKDWTTITNSTSNDGSEPWVVPGKATTQAQIRVSSVDGAVFDISDNDFTISTAVGDLFEVDDTADSARPIAEGETQSHTIHQPGDEDWVKFTLVERSNVNLTMTGASGDTVMELYGPNDPAALVAQDDDSGPGQLSEVIRTGGNALATGDYWVRIREKSGSAAITSGYTVTLVTSPGGSVKLTAPNGGQTWAAGSNQLVTWTSFQISGNVKLEWYDGQTWWMITDSAANNGVYVWTVPTVGTNQAKVRVTPVNDPVAQDESDGVFTITPPPAPSLQVTFPGGGESLQRGSKREITWNSTDVQGNVRIEYSLNGGANWTVLALSSANDGSEEWTVPDTPSLQALVRVSAVNGSAVDQSDNVFFIPGPTPDSFEADDSVATAKEIANGATQDRSIHAAGNADWVKIVLPAKRRIILTTAGAAGGDTVITLYRANGKTVVASNDDVSGSRYSRIQTKPQTAGTYYVRVVAKGSSTLDAYTLSLQLKK